MATSGNGNVRTTSTTFSPAAKVYPVPNYGSVPIKDILHTLFFMLVQFPFIFASHLLRRPFSKTPRTWREDLKRLFIRNFIARAPRSVYRQPKNLSAYSKSTRYKQLAPNLDERITRPSFAGTWLYKTAFQQASDPAHAEITIYYIHGGGFVFGDPLSYSPLLLRIAETLTTTHNKSVSAFLLDYSFAPEAVFPAQLDQALAGYTYLVHERGIPPARIALMGDSAGGSLVLALLTKLATEGTAPRAGGAFLLSPWVSLVSEEGYAEKEEAGSDLLLGWGLAKWARMATEGSKSSPAEIELYTEFATRVAGRGSWKEILPAKTRVWAGEDELFLRNIQEFVRIAREDGADVECEVEAGEPHDWQYVQAVGNEDTWLKGEFGSVDDGQMRGGVEIGDAVTAVMARSLGLQGSPLFVSGTNAQRFS